MMKNLWPKKLIQVNNSSKSLELNTILAVQAEYLRAATLGVIEAGTELSYIDSAFSICIFIWPRGRKQMRYELLRLRSMEGSDFSVIETYHMGEDNRYRKLTSSKQIETALERIFQDDGTLRIINSLAAESLNTLEEDHDLEEFTNKSNYKSNIETPESRVIEIGPLVKDNTNRMLSRSNILGISGFISSDTIRALIKRPGGNLSSFKKINDHFLVELEFIGPIRMSLNTEELITLQKQAKQVFKQPPN